MILSVSHREAFKALWVADMCCFHWNNPSHVKTGSLWQLNSSQLSLPKMSWINSRWLRDACCLCVHFVFSPPLPKHGIAASYSRAHFNQNTSEPIIIILMTKANTEWSLTIAQHASNSHSVRAHMKISAIIFCFSYCLSKDECTQGRDRRLLTVHIWYKIPRHGILIVKAHSVLLAQNDINWFCWTLRMSLVAISLVTVTWHKE